MMVATHQRMNATGVAAMLLALALLNAVALCAAAISTAPVHPCCPASQQQSTTKHCVKLGCAMSDPALQVKSQNDPTPAWAQTPPAAVTARHSIAAFAVVVPSPLSTHDRSITFHQLLI
jgi:RES domain-containing protein